MQNYLIEILECPLCHGNLDWKISKIIGDRIEEAKIICKSCATTYLVCEGIGIFLTPDLERNDLWEHADSGLIKHLRLYPDHEKKLMESSITSLNPTDQFYRALVLEERKKYAEAKLLEEMFNYQ